MFLKSKDVDDADISGWGQLWVLDTEGATDLMFTNDDGDKFFINMTAY